MNLADRIAKRAARAPGRLPAVLVDVLRAASDIPAGPYAPLARRVRRRLAPAPGLEARLQVARLLALLHRATDEERVAVLACLDAEVRAAALPVASSADLRLLRIVDLVFDVREALALLETNVFTLRKEARP
jgi:hypothetical protein